MATFKHISSKNADYGAAEQYLTFEHDEFTMKPTLDGNGRLVLRDDYRISSLNCGDEDFAIACMRSNLKYGKNQKREDVKSHHYIISFDPRDVPDNGLTVDRAQALGEQFCKEHFPGHQALVCTHPDGHNHSGNIHVHIVINSLRIAEVPLLPYMERPADTREGCKHRCTDAAMEYFKAEVMEMCHRENLYQIDLLNGSKNRITEREYWAKRKGQAALDKENASQAATGEPPKQTKFETDKEKLRRTIRAALSSAVTFEDFSGKLLQQGVTVKESRGRLSYLTPDRTKPITARKLGDDFDRAAVLEALTINAQNAARAAETPLPQQEYPRSIKDRLQRNKTAINAPKQDASQREVVQRMVDIAAKKAEGKGKGYEKWATLHNLKQMAATMSVYEESGFSSPEALEAALAAASAGLHEVTGKLKAVESTLREKKDLQKQLLAYIKTKPARDGLKAQKTEKARKSYREQHESEFIISESAARYFKAQGIQKLPASKALQAEIEQLTKAKNALYNEYREKKENVRELQTVKSNLDKILRREPERRKGRENER
ncbi:relaxase [bacterium 1XD42-8]|nr:relaxase [bacterium 1XD42-8]